jgi:eukaryotic-like serine/threonine-protein kinase
MRIGHYRILAKLGEGGMGVVYEALQESPRRSVALKIVRGGGLVDEISVKLFQREAEALARLDHPNIAAIYEAGQTDEGQHFFAMELVRGTTLDAWRASRPAVDAPGEIAARLRIFRAICDAVGYAHQRGVIHRDLKPGNILVSKPQVTETAHPSSAALPLVKILDFGLARIIDSDVGGASIATELGAIKGTLAYMSPEQARGNPANIDTRADVFALGVILYELLTGKRPLDIASSSIVEALRTISEGVATPITETWTARTRIDADLATIVHKALEKDPNDRYSSAAALAEDIDRFLASQPILARPPSTLYQLRKLMVRRKGLFAAATLGLAALIAFGIAMSVLYARSERNLGRALGAESEARENFRLARGAVDRYFTTVSENPDLRAHGLERLRRSLLETARVFYTDFVARQNSRKDLRADLGGAMIRLANMDRTLGDSAAAEEAGLEGLRIYGELAAQDPSNLHYRRELAILQSNLGLLYADTSRSAEAELADRSALELDGALVREGRNDAEDDGRRANTLDNLAMVCERTSRLDEAEKLHREAVDLREALVAQHPEEASFRLELVQSYNNMATLFGNAGRASEAEPFLLRALPIAEKLVASAPDSPQYENVLAASYSNLAGVLMLDGRLDEARGHYQRELETRRRLSREHPGVIEYELFLGSVCCNLGELEVRSGQDALALPALDESLKTFDALLARDPRNTVGRYYASYTLSWRAGALEKLGRNAEALADWERAIALDDRDNPALRSGRDRVKSALTAK